MPEERPSWAEETVPLLGIGDLGVAEPWYGRLGFRTEWVHRSDPGSPAFASMKRGPEGPGVRIFLSEHPAAVQGIVYLRVSDVAPVAAEFDAEVHESASRIEVYLDDPFGNRIRVGSLSGKGQGPGYTYGSDGQ